MLCKIVLLSFIFASCKSQEHLTCLRTDDVISPLPSRTANLQQGPPGKRGPIGAKGSVGQKGSKGNPGVFDNSILTDFLKGYKVLDDGWVALFNGYQYKTTPSRQSWEESRSSCQRFGGDLAVYGIQSIEKRRNLITALKLGRIRVWIGLNDKATEGEWFWVNGERALNEEIIWLPGQPDDAGNNEDCAELVFSEPSLSPGTNDKICTYSIIGICEKPIIGN